MRLSPNIKELQPSPTLALRQRVQELTRKGHTILDMSVGEPDLPMPRVLREAAKQAIDEGWTRYTPVGGLLALREKLAEHLNQRKGTDYKANEIIVSTGAKQCIAQAVYSLVGPGDEVLLLAPYWPSYVTQIQLAGAQAVSVPTRAQDHYQPDLELLQKAITPRTKMIILNSPNNPTGAVYNRATVEAIAEIACKHDIWLLSDEIYERLTYHGEHPVSPAELSPEVRARTILVNGFSKSCSMAGWRLGYMAGPKEVIAACEALQGAWTSNTNAIAQRTALAALDLAEGFFDDLRGVFEQRLLQIQEGLHAIPNVEVPTPQGAFYILPDFHAYFGLKSPQGAVIDSSLKLADYLLLEGKVATVPGEPFEAPTCLRLAYAMDKQIIQQATRQIQQALAQLR
ncbi:MAG: pyridoxal phosphate-dependent aminotransferase [Myxococcales bacterium]|nr:pyridoxal phosphate-dependent aminotransferase [Myxococcales bacterium]